MSSMSRRRLLGGLGGSVLAGTFCDRLLAPAHAGTMPFAKRLIILFTPDGTYEDDWKPDVNGDGTFEFDEGSMLEPLSQHKEDLILINGLDVYNAPSTVSCQHAYGLGAMLTNVAQRSPFGGGYYTGDGGEGTPTDGMSLDQYVASIIGNESRFRSLELGVQTNVGTFYTDDAYTRMCYSGPGVPVVSDDNPANVYSRLYDPLLGVNQTVTKRRKSVLDLAYRDLKDLHGRLSTAERSKLDLHLQAIEDIERSWSGTLACVAPTSPDVEQFNSNAMFPDVTKAQIDLLVTAIACGMTNVGTLQLSQTVSYMVMTWLGHSADWHTLSHKSYGSSSVEQYVEGTRWFMEQVSYLLDRLKSFPDPELGASGTLLDSTIVLVCHEMSDSVLHSFTQNQYILAGNAGGRWATGKYHEVEDTNHGALLVSICNAMGIDIDVFGDPEAGDGGLEVLS
jgi:hypothetical protein